MYIAYSALQPMQQPNNTPEKPGNELLLRYQAYQTTCSKYRREIADIQKYMPGWQPKFY
jgi:hypothetical protein